MASVLTYGETHLNRTVSTNSSELQKPFFSKKWSNHGWLTPLVPVVGKRRPSLKESQEFKARLSYRTGLRPAGLDENVLVEREKVEGAVLRSRVLS